ncbi:MAG: hypothetical protein NXH87_12975 [Rhodobiaceae bacterium]|nr:hypothetical protein RHODOSMS8_03578 [Rhodobiaceae bacterium]MCR9242284.1 hypothetical protein [Rhodobiaceae bacterium]
MQFFKNMSRFVAWPVVALALIACGPVIETHYDYAPPASQAGMQCLAACQQGQNQCNRDAAEAVQQCRYNEERRVEDEYYEARERYNEDRLLYAAAPEKFSKPTEPTKGYPSYYQCDNQGSQCQANFNMCYRSCGGQVRERQVCVANCEE